MSDLHLRIELPAYSHSFNIDVPLSSTIQQVKEEISRTCPGQPRTEGQRLIWRGRNLANEEKVEELWKSSTDSHTLHLAVHPSAWAGQPPEIPNSSTEALQDVLPEPPVTSSFPPSMIRSTFPLEVATPAPTATPYPYRPIPYIATKHQNAVQALMTGAPPLHEAQAELRHAAKAAIERVGWIWPAVLDEPYPAYEAGGLKYEPTFINGQRYLSLVDSNAAPTPVQKHALSILSYTFTLLNLSVTSSAIVHTSTHFSSSPDPAPHVNQILRQLGIPQLRVVQNHNQNQNNGLPQLRELPLRPLLMPLFMLLFRTVLLLYFVAPARKPIFGILILAWMLYEIWQPIRNGLIRLRVQRPNGGGLNQPQNQNQQPNVNVGVPGLPPNDGGRGQQAPLGNGAVALGLGARNLDAQAGVVFDTLANLNLQEEQAILDQAHQVPVAEAGVGHKVAAFFGLLFSTLHPAVWNRRRAALRRREGVIRTEANMRREPAPRNADEEEREETEEERRAAETRQQLREQHARRPRWVQQYMERVLAEEWVDDLD